MYDGTFYPDRNSDPVANCNFCWGVLVSQPFPNISRALGYLYEWCLLTVCHCQLFIVIFFFFFSLSMYYTITPSTYYL